MPDHKMFNERPESQDRFIKFLEKMGYEYISRSEAEVKRGKLTKVLFEDELIRFLRKQTYRYRGQEFNFSGESISRAVKEIDVSLLKGLALASKEIYNLLTMGISLEEKIIIDGDNLGVQSFDMSYIDFDNLDNNIWQVTEEFSVERGNGKFARPDIVIMVNGIPLVVIECKKSSVDVKEGISQNVRNMLPDYIPQLFKYSQLVIAANPNKVMYGTCGTSSDYFVEWREQEIDWQMNLCKKISPDGQVTEQDRAVISLLDKRRLLEIIKSFILYDNNIKKVARHQQFFAINKAMKRIKGLDGADTKSGVIWHTQGSGKSLTMVMLVKKIQSDSSIQNPRFLMVTDRVNLDKQIRDNFLSTQMAPIRAKTGNGLKSLLKDKGNIIITTLINKFETVVKQRFETEESENIFVFIDEAHRSQYSAMYNYMRDVLPYSTMIAFTGTPLISKKKKNTYAKFGPPIDSYTMKRSIEDNITVPLVYEGRKVKQTNPIDKINDYFENITKDLPANLKDDLKEKWSRFKPLAETDARINLIAFDIHDHFTNYCLPKKLKGIVVCSSREAAVDMYKVLKTLDKISPAVVISFEGKKEGDDDNDTPTAIKKINNYSKNVVEPMFGSNYDLYDDTMCNRFTDPDGDINILIVKDKLLTGFDAPVAGVLYIDKSIQQHSLLQAIARVNRVYSGKDFGLIIDYWGIFSKLNQAIDIYNDAESGFTDYDSDDIEDAIFGPVDEKNKLEQANIVLWNMFASLDKNAVSNVWQLHLKDEQIRNEFYEKLANFAKLLNLALTNREIYKEVGFDNIEKYRNDYLFFKKLKDSVAIRYNDKIDFSKYEDGIRNLLNTFVLSTDIQTVVKPVAIDDIEGMKNILEKMESKDAKADTIRTKIVSELQQKRYDDPLLFVDFSVRIKKTLEKYEEDRNADSYLETMEKMADDFRHGRTAKDYPTSIENDSDAKSFYGAIVTKLTENKTVNLDLTVQETIADYAVEIKEEIKLNTKRDWRYNTVVHKQIRRSLDDNLFDLFDELGIDINKNESIDILDLIIDEIMKAALVRY